MPGMNNFFNELIQKDYFEKQASENENIKNALGDCSSSVLQKLAHELGALSEEKPSLQEKLAETEPEEKEEDKEEGKEAESERGESDSEKEEEDKEAESESDSEKEEEKEEDKEAAGECDNKGDCENADTPEENEKCDNKGECENDKEAGEREGSLEKEASEREAYFTAQEKLASSNVSVADFIFEKCANEHVSEYIAETAEKLASMYDKSALQIADEILDSVMSKLG